MICSTWLHGPVYHRRSTHIWILDKLSNHLLTYCWSFPIKASFVNDDLWRWYLGFPCRTLLISFPKYLCYTISKVRCSSRNNCLIMASFSLLISINVSLMLVFKIKFWTNLEQGYCFFDIQDSTRFTECQLSAKIRLMEEWVDLVC